MHRAWVEPCIITTLRHRGRGAEHDPVRVVRQFWSLQGELLGEVDTCPTDHLANIDKILSTAAPTENMKLVELVNYVRQFRNPDGSERYR